MPGGIRRLRWVRGLGEIGRLPGRCPVDGRVLPRSATTTRRNLPIAGFSCPLVQAARRRADHGSPPMPVCRQMRAIPAEISRSEDASTRQLSSWKHWPGVSAEPAHAPEALRFWKHPSQAADDRKRGRMRTRRARNRARGFRDQALCTIEAREGRGSALANCAFDRVFGHFRFGLTPAGLWKDRSFMRRPPTCSPMAGGPPESHRRRRASAAA